MNIYLYETKKQTVSTLSWVLILGFFVWACMAFFETFADDRMMSVINEFPEGFKRAFGIDMDISRIIGYFGFIAIFVYLCAAIFACNLGINAVSAEERDLTADFLVPKPVTRSTILTMKILSGITHMVLLTLTVGAVCVVSVELYKGGQDYSARSLYLILLGCFVLQVLFYTIGLFISVALKTTDSPMAFALGIPFGFYMLDTFDTLLKDTFLRYLIPFDYFDIRYMVDSSALKTYGVVLSLTLIAAYTAGSYLLYARRNISTAM